MKKKLLSLSVLIAILWGCCNVEDTPKTNEKPANYIVTFDANGGKGTMPQQIFVADTPQPLNPNTFKRDGYVFSEWNTTADGKGVTYLSGSYYSLTSDIKLYAQWNAEEEKKEDEENPDNPEQTYSVTYKSQYGTVPSKISGLKKDDELTILQLQELVTTGYTFAGWYNGENEITTGHKITCDLELTAKWDVNTYTVIFYDNGGDGNMEYQNFTYNAEQALNANAFTREGYTFAGWAASDDGKVIYADKGKVKNLTAENGAIVALYAVWTDNDKVSPVIFSQPTAVDYGESVTLSCATEGAKISYTIDGVTAEYTDAIVITKDVIITAFATKDGMKDSDMSIASYTVKTYRVTYRSEYGTEPDKIMGLKKGDTLTEEQLAGITADGYTFAGWYNGENKIEAGYIITCDLELTAKWDANTYTVKFDSNDGSGEMTSQTFTYDVEQALTANTFTRDGYAFAGWATSIDGEKVYTDRAKIKNLTSDMDGEVTLYAQWKPVTYTITYNLNGGINAEDNPAGYNIETDTITLSDATQKEGYTFRGWYTDDTFDETKKIVQIAKGTLGDIALYAKWNANTYTVKFDANGGSGSMDSQTFTYDVEQDLIVNVFTCAGFTFAGWATTTNGKKMYNDNESVKNLTIDIDGTITLYAKWIANTNTAYKVEHYQQNINNDEYTFVEADTENKTGTTGTSTVAIAKTYSGFTAKAVEQAKIAADGSTVVKIYYDRNIITLTLNLDGGDGETEIIGKYGTTVNVTAPTKGGYDFSGWNPELPTTIPTENATYTATWNINTYTITYNLDGGTNNTINPTNYTIETETITLIDGKKKGVEFIGWYTDSTFSEENKIFEITKGSVGNIILYAKWRATIVGDIAYSDGSVSAEYDNTKQAVGIVIAVNNGVATKIVSLSQTSEEYLSDATKWCNNYTDAAGNSNWYLTTVSELNLLYSVKNKVNVAIDKIIAGGGSATKLGTSWYISSSKYGDGAYGVHVQDFSDGDKYNTFYCGAKYYSVRAVRAF